MERERERGRERETTKCFVCFANDLLDYFTLFVCVKDEDDKKDMPFKR